MGDIEISSSTQRYCFCLNSDKCLHIVDTTCYDVISLNQNCGGSSSYCCSNVVFNCLCGCSECEQCLQITAEYLFIAMNILVVIGNILLSIILGFTSQSTVLFSIFVTFVLSIMLSGFKGIHTKRREKIHYDRKKFTIIKNMIFAHSHHTIEEIRQGKEFVYKNKFFCTGCYGLLIGSLFSLTIMLYYLIFGLEKVIMYFMVIIIPFLFLPLIMRYTFWLTMPTKTKFVANMLIPVGCSFMLIIMDYYYQNWAINLLIIVIISWIAFLRSFIPTWRQNREINVNFNV